MIELKLSDSGRSIGVRITNNNSIIGSVFNIKDLNIKEILLKIEEIINS